MGIVKIVAAMPAHIKAIFITVIALIGAWMVITPLYLKVLSWADTVPVWGWMLVGLGLILFAAKFGKAVM